MFEFTYDAIVLSYERPGFAARCVEKIRAALFPPRRVIVFHNAPSTKRVQHAVNVFSDVNFSPTARHAIGQLCRAEACLFVDEDVRVHPELPALMMDGLKRHPNSVVGYTGRNMVVGKRPYSGSVDVRNVKEDTPVDIVKGRVHAVRRNLLGYAALYDLPGETWREDDIVLNCTIQLAEEEPSYILAGARASMANDDEEARTDVGCSARPDHMERRDAACRAFMAYGWPIRKEPE